MLYVLKIVLFFIFTNLIQIKEKTCVQVTVCFPDYAFNENIHLLFSQMECFPNISFYKHISYESWEKNKLLLAWFLANFVMLPAWLIALANWFASMPACMRAIIQVSLTSLHVKAEFNEMIIVLIMRAIVH